MLTDIRVPCLLFSGTISASRYGANPAIIADTTQAGVLRADAGGLKLVCRQTFVQLIKHCHSVEQAKEKDRSIDCTCLQRIDFLFSLLS